MTREVAIKELMWEYNYTREKAETIVKKYEDTGAYEELIGLLRYKLFIPVQDIGGYNV